MRTVLVRYLFAVCVLVFYTDANAAKITMSDINNSGCDNLVGSKTCITLLLQGEITKGDASKLHEEINSVERSLFEKLKLKARVGMIYFDSPGGDLIEAMAIGRLIREALISTQVTHDSSCYSACVIAYLGGVERIAVGPIGIHSFYSKDFIGVSNFAEASKNYNEVSSLVEKYLKELRIPISLLDEMKMVPPNDVKVLKFDELQRLGLIGIDPVYAQMKNQN